jgi:pilus assembly protein CpaE
VRRGVSDYVIAPVTAIDVVRSVCNLFASPEAKAVGRIIAVVGAKGGVGASTISHNVAWAIARELALDSVVADLDLAFGTAGLDYKPGSAAGMPMRVLARTASTPPSSTACLSKCTDHLSLLAAPATLDRVYDFGPRRSIRSSIRCAPPWPCIVLDVPHQWSGWTKRALIWPPDDILIVGAPRPRQSAQHQEPVRPLLKASRPTTARRCTACNQVGMPKRPEINASEFAKADREPADRLDPVRPQMFGSAANNGQMIAEISANHRTTEMFLQIAQRLTGRGETKKPKGRCCHP